MRLLAIVLLALLAACGQSGALYLPEEPEPAPASGQAAPATTEASPAKSTDKDKDNKETP